MDTNLTATESEKAVLSAVIIDGVTNENPTVILRTISELQPQDFADVRNREFFSILSRLHKRGAPFFDAVAIAGEAKQSKLLNGTDGIRYINGIFEGAMTTTGFEYHIGEIKKARGLRNTAAFKNTIADLPIGDGFLEKAEQAFLGFREKAASGKGVSSFREIMSEAFDELDRAIKGEGTKGVPSGFVSIDKYTGGWQPGELIIIAARPGVGKSVFAKDCAEAAKVPALYFSLEMSNSELAKRHLSGLSGVEFDRIKTGGVSDNDIPQIVQTMNHKSNLPIFYSDKADVTVNDIRSLSGGMKIKEGIGLVIVDYLQLIKPTERLTVRQVEVSEISRQLKILSRDLEIPVICLSQLNRECEKRTDKRPILADLRESGAIEQDADIVAFLFREHMYDNQISEHQTEFCIAKGRNIQTGTVELYFDGARQRFRSMASRECTD